MPFDNFSDISSAWFESHLGEPTPVQKAAWEAIHRKDHTLIAAPTGSGKTLAGFFCAIDQLLQQGMHGFLPEECQVLYISPLKALGNDIHRNLQLPLQGIRQQLTERILPDVQIKVAVRTGDTPQGERAAMVKKPPHILVTTPESLYLLLTSKKGRGMLSTIRTVIVDEIHALVGDKRGSHLALSLQRLEAICENRLQRIGISATQKPIERIAEFLVGGQIEQGQYRARPCTIVDVGHKREMELRIALPESPLTAVMANEVWGEVYEQLVDDIESHDTTLIFVNTRRLAERLSHHLIERLGEDAVAAHHGSMSKEKRFRAEQLLKEGKMRCIVATASLELGIDIGSVNLVCQIGSPRSIATFLQRVGRSGHSVQGKPKGKIYPLTRDELVESAAMFDAIRRGELDAIIIPEAPIDILAQQIVAEVAAQEWEIEALHQQFSRAYVFQHIDIDQFKAIIQMLADGFTTRRGRRSAYLHYDAVNGKVRPRKNARLTAITAGGAIPDNFDFDVVLEPQGQRVGTLNEEFAIESLPGDIFQLGNSSWRIVSVEIGKVRVEDAKGLPPTIPFWFGEAPGRTLELSEAVSRLRQNVSDRFGELEIDPDTGLTDPSYWLDAQEYLQNEVGIAADAAKQIAEYLAATHAVFGLLPTQDKLVLERFFDEAGDMHIVMHSPFGSRLNRAWGLSLRKRFCKKFNFELQAAANEDAIILSLGSTHSFPLEEVFAYLKSNTVREILVQALLDSPMFEVRWRWNASRALAILRNRAGKKVPPQLQRMAAEDLVALLFPDQLACLENIQGARDVPEHPLIDQTIHDCLTEAMDIDNLEALLDRINNKELITIAKDLTEPSAMAQEIINAKPYAFLDDEDENRRASTIQYRRWVDPAEAKNVASLSPIAIDQVRKEAWPLVRDRDELHDALVMCGFLTEAELEHNDWAAFIPELQAENRVFQLELFSHRIWMAIERWPQLIALYGEGACAQKLPLLTAAEERSKAMLELVRGRLEHLGPITEAELAAPFGPELGSEIQQALFALENEGFAFRGQYSPDAQEEEWCERRLLARIHKYSIAKLRKEVEPADIASFMRMQLAWHHLTPETQLEGPKAVQAVLEQLEGSNIQAAAWEADILPTRIKDYEPQWLDNLCLSGKITWGRTQVYKSTSDTIVLRPVQRGPMKTTPICIMQRKHKALWVDSSQCDALPSNLSSTAQVLVQALLEQGALFFDELEQLPGLLPSQVEEALSELVNNGLVTSDSYTGVRALLVPAKNKKKRQAYNMDEAGRWSMLAHDKQVDDEAAIEYYADLLLRRYGVVFRRLWEKEKIPVPWRTLLRYYRLQEARGVIRGGRFVDGMYGEHFALPEAIQLLKTCRHAAPSEELISISAADPVNLTGIVLPGKRIANIYSNRILFKDGIPVAVKNGKDIQLLGQFEAAEAWKLQKRLVQRTVNPKLRSYLGYGIG